MEKKYRLKLPDRIVLEDLEVMNESSPYISLGWLIKHNGSEITDQELISSLPFVWLEEIKQPEILSAEEIIDEVKNIFKNITERSWENLFLTQKKAISNGIKKARRFGALELWHQGGVGELVEVCSNPFSKSFYTDIALALEKIQKPE